MDIKAKPEPATTDSPTWKEVLREKIPQALREEIDTFDMQLELRTQGKVEEKLFAETRLRRGVYGQRYDNGKRHDGTEERALGFPDRQTKGPNTVWDAPGMQRIKIPFGGVTPDQLDVLADLAEEYSDDILHVTTRQDFQLHFIHIEDTPDIMRRLGAVGITTREACGNAVRNVTACPTSGVCPGEAFDTTPYAAAIAEFLLGHPDAQDFGRKFKVAFSGCADEPCGLTRMHDLGFVARTRVENGAMQRGFEVHVGGGLGAVPHQAKVLETFVPELEILPLAQALCRVFARDGEKKSRGRARLKFLLAKIGVDELRRRIEAERAKLPEDPRWVTLIDQHKTHEEVPLRPGEPLVQLRRRGSEAFEKWRKNNVKPQRQAGYVVVTLALPLGDITSRQTRSLAQVARRFVGDHLRTTVEQNMVLRWVSESDLPELYEALAAIDLADPVAETIADVVSCPGTDTCKLGIAASRGLAGELKSRLEVQEHDEAVAKLRIRISGCFNGCGQHHVGDLGFYGVTRKRGTHQVPFFHVLLGGQWSENAGAFGLTTGVVPSKNVPAVVDRIAEIYTAERDASESFQAFVRRVGKAYMRKRFDDLTEVPPYEVDPAFYSDWGDPREFTMADYGVGECAGEVVPQIEFGLQASEQQVFEAQLSLDGGDAPGAADKAYRAMLKAAQSLVETENLDVGTEPDRVVTEFRDRFFSTRKFFDPYAGGKFANYLFRIHDGAGEAVDDDEARRRVEEAQLFIEASYRYYERSHEGGAS